jgi:hypothetical protein
MKKKELLKLVEVLGGRITILERRVRELEGMSLYHKPINPYPSPPSVPPPFNPLDFRRNSEDPPTVRFTDNTASVAGPTGLRSGQGTIPASLVKSLRDYTGASMENCKNALYMFTGDFDKASRYLHDKGQAVGAKGRPGLVGEPSDCPPDAWRYEMNSWIRAGAENWPMGGPPIKEGTNQ